jgi:general stress protein 26
MDQKEQILKILKDNLHTVIGTVNANRDPETAVIAFVQKDNLEILFGTSNKSRKYQNLKNNPRASFTVGWDSSETVQYEGLVEELTQSAELEEWKAIFAAKNPTAKKFEADPEQRYFKVSPKWIRYSDLSTDPITMFEINL